MSGIIGMISEVSLGVDDEPLEPMSSSSVQYGEFAGIEAAAHLQHKFMMHRFLSLELRSFSGQCS